MMTTLTKRGYIGETDLEPIAALINACEAVDCLDEGSSIAELRQEIEAPGFDRDRNLHLWETPEGTLIAFAQLWIPESGEVRDGFLWFRVHPMFRGGTVEREIVAWGEARMQEVSQECGVSVSLRSGTRESDGDRIRFLESCGFAVDRYFFRMERVAAEPIPTPQLPPEFTVQIGEQQKNGDAWVELYNQSFIDHWNFHTFTRDRLDYELANLPYRPTFDLVAVSPDGQFAGFCYCTIYDEKNRQTGRNEGWITVLGTRRGFRHQGIGRALLLAGMQQLQAAGVETILLSVDAQSPTGALKLYESVGFRKSFAKVSLFKALESPNLAN
jgi:mycothiol synthase